MKSQLPTYQKITTDILVIGGGGAGLRAAIEAAQHNLNIHLLCKEVLGCAHTGMAMGGMNVALEPPATPALHFQDTMEGGWKINNPQLVKVFTEEMPARIKDLEDYGLLFDRTPDGHFYTWKGGKQTAPLNVCVGDYTGREMMQALVDQIRKLQIPYQDEFFVTKIFTHKGEVSGALGIDLKTGTIMVFQAKSVILATGGAGRMYQITTNAASNTGDGFAMALELGVELVDMEMVQFHPTGMVFPESVRGVLVTEKVRGHGGKLFNSKGERFLTRYFPEKMELAGRDEIARSIYQEVKEGRGTINGGVYLDVTHLPKGEAEEKIPDVFEQYMAVGVDIRKQPMEIYPTMHHMCGGINITIDGQTNIPGLLAAGEVTGGIHGANRLGGNSIAEGQVFGKRSIIAAKKRVRLLKHHLQLAKKTIEQEISRIHFLLTKKTGISTYALEDKIKETMWNQVGIVRNQQGLTAAQKTVTQLKKDWHKIKVGVTRLQRNKELQDTLELWNMIITAQAVIIAALARKESRGAHSRTDFPTPNPKFFKNIIINQTGAHLRTKFQPIINANI